MKNVSAVQNVSSLLESEMGISGQQCFDVPSFFLQKIGLADSHVNHAGKIKGHRGVAKTINSDYTITKHSM